MGTFTEKVQHFKMPAVEEEEEEGEVGVMRRANLSPPKRKTGGIIEMWITNESYPSPTKELKVLGDEGDNETILDHLNVGEERISKNDGEEEVEVESTDSNSLNNSELLDSSTDHEKEVDRSFDPEIVIEELCDDESVGGDSDISFKREGQISPKKEEGKRRNEFKIGYDPDVITKTDSSGLNESIVKDYKGEIELVELESDDDEVSEEPNLKLSRSSWNSMF